MADVSLSINQSVLPCNGDGSCMVCQTTPLPEETLTCKICVTPWHVACLSVKPATLAATLHWDCPDCSSTADLDPAVGKSVTAIRAPRSSFSLLVVAMKAIEDDISLTATEKDKKRQALFTPGAGPSSDAGASDTEDKKTEAHKDPLADMTCSICRDLADRPVTTSTCGHTFCLKCFQNMVKKQKGEKRCPCCRKSLTDKEAKEPRIDSTFVNLIREAKRQKAYGGDAAGDDGQARTVVYKSIPNEMRPDKAFRTERAKKPGLANAASGRIFVTVTGDHFGPITDENDPEKKKGVVVGDTWANRSECRQWGVHNPMISGIAGQAKCGAQSVILSGGYDENEDHGDWFLYTGSGGRDLGGNKRTNKNHCRDQDFVRFNEALRVSCIKGYPVRVVRSDKLCSSYAPASKAVRYDGIYRVEKCWRKDGRQDYKVCRFLFVRCDNDPAPWTSDEQGDRPRPLPMIEDELENAIDITERTEDPSWDFDEEKGCWAWKKPPPPSQKRVSNVTRVRKGSPRKQQKQCDMTKALLKVCVCKICKNVMSKPVTTPCGHNFCLDCLQGAFAGISELKERTCKGARTLRPMKNVKKCPNCKLDIADFMLSPQVSTQLACAIATLLQLQAKIAEGAQKPVEDAQDADGSNEEMADANGEDLGPPDPMDNNVQETEEEVRKRKMPDDGGNAMDDGGDAMDAAVLARGKRVKVPLPPAV